jgi:hypothetical protein
MLVVLLIGCFIASTGAKEIQSEPEVDVVSDSSMTVTTDKEIIRTLDMDLQEVNANIQNLETQYNQIGILLQHYFELRKYITDLKQRKNLVEEKK